jgi:hypothetical protein
MEQATRQVEKANAKGANGEFLAPNRRLKGFLNGAQEDDDDDAPIADLFPYCTVSILHRNAHTNVSLDGAYIGILTRKNIIIFFFCNQVLFADIAGFTAWSKYWYSLEVA